MRALLRFDPSALAALSVVAMLSCGGDSSGPKNAASVTGVTGDNQLGPTGAPLDAPLSLVLLGTNGQPFSGATVTWSVTSGSATLNPTQSSSDANGYVATNVTLGGTVGPLIVRASTGGIAPIDFHITVVDPCQYILAHPVGTSLNGALTSFDCTEVLEGFYEDLFGLTVSGQVGLTINMNAGFDTYLDLFELVGQLLYPTAGNNDISTIDKNSRIGAILGPGTYIIGASSWEQLVTGTYTLSSATRPQTLTVCADVVWVTRGITVSDNIASTGCKATVTGGETYSDEVRIIALQGSALELKESSPAVDPLLTLYRVDGQTGQRVLVATNNDSAAGNPTAYILQSIATSAVYVVNIGTAAPNQQGAYTFTISAGALTGAPPWQQAASPLDVQPRPLGRWQLIPGLRR
jgi:hypothetical protein